MIKKLKVTTVPQTNYENLVAHVLCVRTTVKKYVTSSSKNQTKKDKFEVPLRESTSFCMSTSFEDLGVDK